MLTVEDIMSREVITLDKNVSIRKVAMTMAEHGIGSIVLSDNNSPVGIITEADITRHCVATNTSPDRPAYTIMTSPIHHTNPDADILVTAATMRSHRIKKLPVVKGPAIIGMVTQTDIIRHLVKAFADLHKEFTKGMVGSKSYEEEAQDLMNRMKKFSGSRNWHMRCNNCGYRFMDPERDGVLQVKECPQCSGKNLSYDSQPIT